MEKKLQDSQFRLKKIASLNVKGVGNCANYNNYGLQETK